jgi:hypothetical protein
VIKNPAFDFSVVTLPDLLLLQQVASGARSRMDGDIMRLFRRKLVTSVGPYGMKGIRLTTRGEFAVRLLFQGQRVRITDSYRIDYMRGKKGVILSVRDGKVDADGVDHEHGYIERAIPMTSVSLRVDGVEGEWMVYRPQDIEAIFDTDMPQAGYFPARDPAGEVVKRRV